MSGLETPGNYRICPESARGSQICNYQRSNFTCDLRIFVGAGGDRNIALRNNITFQAFICCVQHIIFKVLDNVEKFWVIYFKTSQSLSHKSEVKICSYFSKRTKI